MSWTKYIPLVLFLGILAVPFAMRSAAPAGVREGVPRVIIMTPHVRQISEEFSRGFSAWHQRVYGSPAEIDWRGPLGTSEILKLLRAQYTAHLRREIARIATETPERLLDPELNLDGTFKPGDIGLDVVFGGGSFDHGRIKSRDTSSIAVPVLPGGGRVRAVVSPVERIDASKLGEMTELRADVSIDGRPEVRLRVPVEALVGGLDVIRPIAEGAKSVEVELEGGRLLREFGVPMSVPAGLGEEEIAALSPNEIGAERLYDPDQFWIGTALSSFGIVFNRDLFKEAGLPMPSKFEDLTNERLQGLIALADPRQSGSLTTAIDMVINSFAWRAAKEGGWSELLLERDGIARAISAGKGPEVEGAFAKAWRTLREITANARYYASSSTKPPVDVSQGEAAAGLAIDFYGKTQAQSVLDQGAKGEGRVGFVDPEGQTNYDADPVSVLRGGPNEELARRFVRYCLSKEAQSLWQFRAGQGSGLQGGSGLTLGPREYELRRFPIRRDMYTEPYFAEFVDQINPFDRAPKARPVGWRDGIGVMMPAFSVDVAEEQRAAWSALTEARRKAGFSASTLAEMERLFYALPATRLPDGRELAFTAEHFPQIAGAWRESRARGRLKADYVLGYTEFFRRNYEEVVRLSRAGGGVRGSAARSAQPLETASASR
jgi:ABC-type Fe3+ transport system substrate-binding protein